MKDLKLYSTASQKITLLRRTSQSSLVAFCALILITIFCNIAYCESRLIMVTDPACPFCKAWEADVGSTYPKTDIAKNFPIFRTAMNTSLEEFAKNLKPAKGTPTFIFIHDGKEIGRIEGFSSAEMFWWLVEDILMESKMISE